MGFVNKLLGLPEKDDVIEQERQKTEEKAKKWFNDTNNQIAKGLVIVAHFETPIEIKLNDLVLKRDVITAVEKLKEKYPPMTPVIDETFESVTC